VYLYIIKQGDKNPAEVFGTNSLKTETANRETGGANKAKIEVNGLLKGSIPLHLSNTLKINDYENFEF
jgi:hypothetical protein